MRTRIYTVSAVEGLNSTLKALRHIIKMYTHLKWCPATIGYRDPHFHVSENNAFNFSLYFRFKADFTSRKVSLFDVQIKTIKVYFVGERRSMGLEKIILALQIKKSVSAYFTLNSIEGSFLTRTGI